MTVVLLIVTIAALIGIDQAVKYWAVESLQPKGSIDFIHFGDFEIFDLTYLENDGAIFGSMSGQRWFLIGFTSLVIIAVTVFLFMQRKRSKVLNTALLLFIAGGIGNLIDRIRFGYVVDMFEFKPFEFAIFNVADIYVTFAVIILIVYVMFIDPAIEKKTKAAAAEKAEHNE
ncbi:MAG: signal peptidase II [Ruminococcus sp.]|nr:signal peptidase II [Ruminococcus sp.]